MTRSVSTQNGIEPRREIAQAPWATPSPLHAADPPLPGLDGLRARPAFRRLRNGSAARTVQAGSAAAGHFSRLAARAGHAAGRSSRGLPAQHPQDRRRPSVRGQAGRGVERVCARRGHERRARRLSGPFRGVLTGCPRTMPAGSTSYCRTAERSATSEAQPTLSASRQSTWVHRALTLQRHFLEALRCYQVEVPAPQIGISTNGHRRVCEEHLIRSSQAKSWRQTPH